MSAGHPLISVVIPTRNRPVLLQRAVRSALAQSWTNLEVIVVVDGPDAASVSALKEFDDARLRTIALEESVGGSEARNTGVRNAKGAWVALLDDDDEWLSEKLASQMTHAMARPCDRTFVGSSFVERSARGDRILPRVEVDTRCPISEVLFCRQSLTSGTGYVQTSTWLISRDLLLKVPFTKGLRRNQDADWMLHALTRPEVSIAITPDPLVIFYDEDNPERVSRRADWRFHYEWALENRRYFTRKAMAFFLLTSCIQDAVAQSAGISVVFFLLKQSFRLGTPTPLALCFFLYYGLSSSKYRRLFRTRIQEIKGCA